MLSILIVNWNTRDLLDACLASIVQFSSDVEVIVVDNASSDGSAAMIAAKHPWVKLISSAKNLGYAGGNNLAYSNSSGEFVLLLNPDTEIYEDTLALAVSTLIGLPEYGALGARQIFTDGTTQASVRGFPSFWGLVGDFTKLGRLIPALDSYRLGRFDYEMAQDAPQPMGTFLLLRRSALEGLHRSGVRDSVGQGLGSPSATTGYSDATPIGVNEGSELADATGRRKAEFENGLLSSDCPEVIPEGSNLNSLGSSEADPRFAASPALHPGGVPETPEPPNPRTPEQPQAAEVSDPLTGGRTTPRPSLALPSAEPPDPRTPEPSPLMDESFPIFFNEVDLLFRLKQSGWKTWYEPTVRVLHHGAEGTKQVRKSMIWESHRSLVRFVEKHGLVPFLPILRPLILLAAFIRARGVHEGFKP